MCIKIYIVNMFRLNLRFPFDFTLTFIIKFMIFLTDLELEMKEIM